MLTDELTAALRAATEDQPFTPDPGVALARARRVRSRRRATVTVGALGMATMVGASLPSLLEQIGGGDVVPIRPLAAGGPQGPERLSSPGGLSFIVAEDRATEAQPGGATCAMNLVLGPDATPDRIGLPCDPAEYDLGRYASPTDGSSAGVDTVTPSKLWAPFSRQDYVVIGGRRRLVTSGTAPKGTVSVTAVDASGQPLSASLVRPSFTDLVVFAMQSDGKRVTRLHYLLADGRQSEENELATS